MNERNELHTHEGGPDRSSVDRQASEWLVLLDSGHATDEERARFEEWLAKHPGHREAYAAVGATWGRLAAMRGRVGAAGETDADPDRLTTALNVPRRPPGRSFAVSWAAAGIVLLAVLWGALLFLPGDSGTSYRTGIGQQRTVSLPDGSTVELNTDTELRVRYTDEWRQVEMIRGEAFFEVAGDAERPFIVTAGHGAIRAVGTGFAVRLKPAEVVSVVVIEGAVEVVPPADDRSSPRPADPPAPFVLRRGQRAAYDRDATRVEEIAPDELERTQAWRRGLLVFEDASLAEVVSEVNRYTRTRLVIADPRISELRLGGTFKTGNVEALIDVLKKGFGIRAEYIRGDTIELQPEMPDSAQVPL